MPEPKGKQSLGSHLSKDFYPNPRPPQIPITDHVLSKIRMSQI